MLNAHVHDDERHLLAAIELARRARSNGNHPFGALLADAGGNVLLEAENTVVTGRDATGAASLAANRRPAPQKSPFQLLAIARSLITRRATTTRPMELVPSRTIPPAAETSRWALAQALI